MSMLNVVLPWLHNLIAFSALTIAPTHRDASAIAVVPPGVRFETSAFTVFTAHVDDEARRCGCALSTGRDAEALLVAATVSGLSGFPDLALADGETDTKPVPAESMASNTMLLSLEPDDLTGFAA